MDVLEIDIHDPRVKFIEAKPAGWADYLPVKEVLAALEAAGVPKSVWPSAPSDNRCLERAMSDLRSARNLVRPLPKGRGWALVIENGAALDLERMDADEEEAQRAQYEAECAQLDAEFEANLSRIRQKAENLQRMPSLMARMEAQDMVRRWALGEQDDIRRRYYSDWSDRDFVSLQILVDGLELQPPKHPPFRYKPAQSSTVERTSAHKVEITAKVERSLDDSRLSSLRITPEDHPAAPLIRDAFAAHRGTDDDNQGLFKCSQDLSVWFSQTIIPWVRGISTRSRGGSYYVLKGENLRRLESVARALADVSTLAKTPIQLPGGTVIERTTTVRGGRIILKPELGTKEAIEVMVDSLLNEGGKLCDEAAESLTDGKKGARALKTESKQLDEYAEKLKQVEEMLGAQLGEMRSLLDETKAANGMMQLKLQAEKDAQAA